MERSVSTTVQPSPVPEGRLLAVCCQGDGIVAVHSFEDGTVVGHIPVGEHPVHALAVAGQVFVATMGERSVTVIGADGTVEQIPVGVLGPSHVACVGGLLFVTCTASDVVAVIDSATQSLKTRIGVGAEPHELAVSSNRLFVGSRRDGVISVVDTDALSHRSVIKVGQTASVEAVAISPTTGTGYAVDRRGGRLVTFTTGSSPAILGEVPVGRDPSSLTLTNTSVYVPASGDGTVREFDADPVPTLACVHDGFERPVAVYEFDGEMWVVDRERSMLTSLGGRAVDVPAGAIHGLPTETGIVLSHYDDGAVSLVEPGTGVRWSVETGANPLGVLLV